MPPVGFLRTGSSFHRAVMMPTNISRFRSLVDLPPHVLRLGGVSTAAISSQCFTATPMIVSLSVLAAMSEMIWGSEYNARRLVVEPGPKRSRQHYLTRQKMFHSGLRYGAKLVFVEVPLCSTPSEKPSVVTQVTFGQPDQVLVARRQDLGLCDLKRLFLGVNDFGQALLNTESVFRFSARTFVWALRARIPIGVPGFVFLFRVLLFVFSFLYLLLQNALLQNVRSVILIKKRKRKRGWKRYYPRARRYWGVVSFSGFPPVCKNIEKNENA